MDVQGYIREKKIIFGKEVYACLNTIDSIFLFRSFAQTRHKAVDSFLPFVKHTYKLAEEQKMTRAMDILQRNIADEVGIVGGKRHGALAHKTWREWYLAGIG
ncbi:MAG: hypothetical protein COU33_02225, partial [Candidatus Magasanikbacteria bacterium CG10_big_fil_rev_8_21_14_0_10_43_6]